MGDALRVQTRFSDSEEVIAVVGGALARGWLRLPLRVTHDEPFEIVLVAADGSQAIRSYAEVVERAGAGTWIRFLSAAPAPETEKGSRCMLAEVDIDTGDAANDEASDTAEAEVPSLPAQVRRGVLDVLPTVKMPALARPSVPVLPPLLPPPAARTPAAPALADSIESALLAIEPVEEAALKQPEAVAFDTSDVTGEAKLFAAGGELEAKPTDAAADERALDAASVDAASVDATSLGNELDTVAGEIRRDTDAMPPLDLPHAGEVAATPVTEPPVVILAHEAPLVTAKMPPMKKPRSRRTVIVASAAMCVAAASAIIVVSTHGKSAHANTPSAKQAPVAYVDEQPARPRAPEQRARPQVAETATGTIEQPVVEAPPPQKPVAKPKKLDAAAPSPAITDATPIAAPGTCSIVIAASVEDAQVMIDGKARGETPVSADVPCGQPVAIAVHHPRYEVFKTTRTVTGQESMIAKLDRERTTVTIVSDPPGAEVSLDGATIGKTPLKTTVHRYEQSTFNFQAPGYEADWRRIMPKTGASTVTLKLRPSLWPPAKGASRN